mgnify:CR=1 FL=1
MKDLNKIFKWLMWLLFAVSVGILVWGVVKGYPTSAAEGDNGTVNALIYWCYAMIGIAVFCAVVFGIAVSVANNPKSLVKILIGLVAAAAVCGIAYVLAPASPAIGMLEQPTAGTLKFTDTVLYIVAFAGILSVAAIIFGEIWGAVRNK